MCPNEIYVHEVPTILRGASIWQLSYVVSNPNLCPNNRLNLAVMYCDSSTIHTVCNTVKFIGPQLCLYYIIIPLQHSNCHKMTVFHYQKYL